MGQMLSGGAGSMPMDTSVGYSPQGPAGTPTAESSGGTPLGPGPASGGDPASQISGGLGIAASFANLLGKDQKEREKNAKAFAAMVKDVGSLGKSITDSTLMKRMMEAQMTKPIALMGGGSASGGVAAIPKTFDATAAAASMNKMGYK